MTQADIDTVRSLLAQGPLRTRLEKELKLLLGQRMSPSQISSRLDENPDMRSLFWRILEA